jgi:hypothetical protein
MLYYIVNVCAVAGILGIAAVLAFASAVEDVV